VYLALYRAAAQNERDERRRARIDYAHSRGGIRARARARARSLARSLARLARVAALLCNPVPRSIRSSDVSYRERAGDRILPRHSPEDASRARARARVIATAGDLGSNDFALSKIGYTEIE